MTARGYEMDDAVKNLTTRVKRLELKEARNRPASGISYTDGGGSYGGGFPNIQDILDGIADGTLPGSFLTVTLGGKGTVQALGTLGATETLDLANANKFWGTLDQNCTISTTGWTNLKDVQISVELIQDGTGGWTPTFSGVTWIGGTPTWVTTAGTVTHVVLFSRDGGTTIYGAVVGAGSGSGGSSLPWFNVTDAIYGAVNDATTDDTAAINLAIAAWNAAGEGVLYFPGGAGYKVTGALTTVTAAGTILGDGRGQWSGTDTPIGVASSINCTSQTAVLFTITSPAVEFQRIALLNTYAGATSAGSAVQASSTEYRQKVDFLDVLIEGFYIGYDCRVNGGFSMVNTDIYNPTLYGVKVQNTVIADGGGFRMTGCNIVGNGAAGSYQAGVHIETSGGNRIVNTNILSSVNAVELDATANSSILLIEACSFENHTGDGVRLEANGFSYQFVTVSGCQIAQAGANTTGHAIYADDVDSIIVTDNHLKNDNATPAGAISLNNGDRAYIGRNLVNGWSSRLATSSFTNLNDDTGAIAEVAITGVPTSGQVPTATSGTAATWQTPAGGTFATPAIVLGTAAAAGAASTVIRSDSTIVAFDATVPAALGTAAAGAAAVAARRDHVHPQITAATLTALGVVGQVVMVDGITSPPEPLQTEDGTAWIYADL